MTTVIETSGIPPPRGAAAEMSVPLSFFDLFWVHFKPIRRLTFYNHPCSTAEFLETIVPKLKQSLSLTLKHYLPVAANLLYPLDTEKRPIFRYVHGDSVPLAIAISSVDFDELTGSHAKEADQFYDFMPEMPELRIEGYYSIVPLIALQATLFPGRGICVGLSNHHALGDARSIVGFMWTWAQINKSGSDEEFLSENDNNLPFYDRSIFGDCSRIENIYWDILKKRPLQPSSFPLPTNRVRASFTLHQSDIKKLKNLILTKSQTGVQASSFVVTSAYVWTCMAKSYAAAGEEVGGDEAEVFIYPADGRGRPNSLVGFPVPLNYFGNCLGGGMVKIEHKKLAAEEGFVAAAEAIAGQIDIQVKNKDNFLRGAETWLSPVMPEAYSMRMLVVSGSPKFDLSNADFGWGKGRKVEVLSIDEGKYSMSLCNSWESDGGLVVGLSLPRETMEVFAVIFEGGLNP